MVSENSSTPLDGEDESSFSSSRFGSVTVLSPTLLCNEPTRKYEYDPDLG